MSPPAFAVASPLARAPSPSPSRPLSPRRPRGAAPAASAATPPLPPPSPPAHAARVSRRRVLAAGAAAVAAAAAGALDARADGAGMAGAGAGVGAEAAALAEYRGPVSLGFSFSYPAGAWVVKKKPIKTHMSELVVARTAAGSSAAAGVTVDAVRISRIEDFGSAAAVGAKVVALEQRKDSVLAAALVGARALVDDGLTYYVVEYSVDSGRSVKRFVAKATITGGNLYVFTAQAKAEDFAGADGEALAAMVESFHVQPQYL